MSVCVTGLSFYTVVVVLTVCTVGFLSLYLVTFCVVASKCLASGRDQVATKQSPQARQVRARADGRYVRTYAEKKGVQKASTPRSRATTSREAARYLTEYETVRIRVV